MIPDHALIERIHAHRLDNGRSVFVLLNAKPKPEHRRYQREAATRLTSTRVIAHCRASGDNGTGIQPCSLGLVVVDVDHGQIDRFVNLYPPFLITPSRTPGHFHLWYDAWGPIRNSHFKNVYGMAGEIKFESAYVQMHGDALDRLADALAARAWQRMEHGHATRYPLPNHEFESQFVAYAASTIASPRASLTGVVVAPSRPVEGLDLRLERLGEVGPGERNDVLSKGYVDSWCRGNVHRFKLANDLEGFVLATIEYAFSVNAVFTPPLGSLPDDDDDIRDIATRWANYYYPRHNPNVISPSDGRKRGLASGVKRQLRAVVRDARIITAARDGLDVSDIATDDDIAVSERTVRRVIASDPDISASRGKYQLSHAVRSQRQARRDFVMTEYVKGKKHAGIANAYRRRFEESIAAGTIRRWIAAARKSGEIDMMRSQLDDVEAARAQAQKARDQILEWHGLGLDMNTIHRIANEMFGAVNFSEVQNVIFEARKHGFSRVGGNSETSKSARLNGHEQ